MNSLRVATYNILNPWHAVRWETPEGQTAEGIEMDKQKRKAVCEKPTDWQAYSNWKDRACDIAKMIQESDIVCLQEISHSTIENLQTRSNYKAASVSYHDQDCKFQQHGTAILYNAKKITLLKSFTLHYEGRSSAVAVFQVGEKIVQVASVHITGYNSKNPTAKSKKKGYDQLISFTNQFEKDSQKIDLFIIAGDFNEDLSQLGKMHDRLGYMHTQNYEEDGNRSITEPNFNRKIDWIFFKSPQKTIHHQPAVLETIEHPPSDHLMVSTEFLL